MHISRRMKRMAREILEEDPDAFKVRNEKPSEEFAFDLSVPLEIGSTSELTALEAADDFGAPVAMVPLDQTGVVVFLDFANAALRLDFPSSPVAVAPFVSQICHLIRSEVCKPGSAFHTFISPDEILRLQIRRLFWDSNLAAWTLHWVDPPERPLAVRFWRSGLTRLRDRIHSYIGGELTVDETLDSCEFVLDCDYPELTKEGWGGLTQLVYDSIEEDDYLQTSERKRHADEVFRTALPLIEARLAQLPAEEGSE